MIPVQCCDDQTSASTKTERVSNRGCRSLAQHESPARHRFGCALWRVGRLPCARHGRASESMWSLHSPLWFGRCEPIAKLKGLQRKFVVAQKFQAFRFGEYAGRGSHGADTTGPQGTGNLEAIPCAITAQQAVNVSGIKSVAAS